MIYLDFLTVYFILNAPTISTALTAEFYGPNDSKFVNIHRSYSKYRTGQTKDFNWKVITNLNQFLNLYSDCLLHLINYDGIDLLPPQVPIVLSRYDVVKEIYLVDWLHKNHTRRQIFSFRERNYLYEKIPRNGTEAKWCQRHTVDLECIDIPFVDNSVSVKSWYCETHFYLFPPNDASFFAFSPEAERPPHLIIPPSFRRLFWTYRLNWYFYKCSYCVDLHLVNRERHDVFVNDGSLDVFQYWLNTLSKAGEKVADTVTWVNRELLRIQPKVTGYSKYLRRIEVELGQTEIVCKYCHKETALMPTFIGDVRERALLQEKVKELNKDVDKIIYKVWSFGSSFDSPFMRLFKPLPDDWSRRFRDDLLANKEVPLDYTRWQVEVRLFRSVFRNATFMPYVFYCTDQVTRESLGSVPCDDNSQPLAVLIMSGKNEFAHAVLHERYLKFISCGFPRTRTLPFDQLISIFDLNTWLFIFVLTIATSLFSAGVLTYLKHESWNNDEFILELVPSLVSYFKALLEQGDPIRISIWKIPSLRWAFGSYLFVALVLSNAYKYENITQLTLPRSHVPYDNFDLLVEDNFTIYTRRKGFAGSDNLINLRKIPIIGDLIINLLDSLGTKKLHKYNGGVENELLFYAHWTVSYKDVTIDPRLLPGTFHEMINHTEIHPNWFHLLFGDEECSVFGRRNKCNVLQNCSKTALFLPDVDAHTKYYEMKKDGYEYAYLSQEDYFKNYYALTIWRWVHPLILQRLQALAQSGLLDRWSQLISVDIPRIRMGFGLGQPTQDPKASSIRGNIAVVFALHATGILLTFVVFLEEKRWGLRGICMTFGERVQGTLSRLGSWNRNNRVLLLIT